MTIDGLRTMPLLRRILVAAAALAGGTSPVSSIGGLRDAVVEAREGAWIPRDQREQSPDALTLRDALVDSNNAAAVLLQQRIGTGPVLQLARDLGVPDQPAVPSLAVGSGLVMPLDLTAAYAVFPNGGFRVRPRGIVSVSDADDRRVHHVHVERERVLSPEVAFPGAEHATGCRRSRHRFECPYGGRTGPRREARRERATSLETPGSWDSQ